jgi:hypothetical protein
LKILRIFMVLCLRQREQRKLCRGRSVRVKL